MLFIEISTPFCNLDKVFLLLLSCDNIFHRFSCMLPLALVKYPAFFVLLKYCTYISFIYIYKCIYLYFYSINMLSGPVNLPTYPHWSKRGRMADWLMALHLYIHGKYMQHFACSANQPVLFLSSSLFLSSILCLRAMQTHYITEWFHQFWQAEKIENITRPLPVGDITFFTLGEHCYFSGEVLTSQEIGGSCFLYISLVLSPDSKKSYTCG